MRRALVAALVITSACGAPVEPADSGPPPDAPAADAPGCTPAACDDGSFCNGEERCVAGACEPAAAGPCMPSQTCDESADECVTQCEVDNDADDDGSIGMPCGGTDCDDADAARYPGNTEICDPGDRDEDCDPLTFGARDADGDAWPDDACCNVSDAGVRTCGRDCDDAAPSVHPTLAEACDALDNDCDGATDEGILGRYFRDRDGDLYGDPDDSMMICAPMGEYRATIAGDCDDGAPDVHPGLPEICDSVDQDCDGTIHDIAGADVDADGYASCEGLPRPEYDCDDEDPMVHPGVAEVCDGLDVDCVGRSFEPLGCGPGDPGCTAFDATEDGDRDGFAPPSSTCTGGSLPRTDCDDTRGWAAPTMPEWCTPGDDDCDGVDTDATGCAIVDLRASTGITCARRASGEIDCWGPDRGQPTPAPLQTLLPGAIADWTISHPDESGGDPIDRSWHLCVLRPTGTIECMGYDDHGQLGTGAVTYVSDVPRTVAGVTDARRIAAGEDSTCAIRSGGSVVCWGSNRHRQIDEAGSGTDILVPTAIPGVAGALEIAANQHDACAIVEASPGGARSIACWGESYSGTQVLPGSALSTTTRIAIAYQAAIGPGSFGYRGLALRPTGGIIGWQGVTLSALTSGDGESRVSMDHAHACFVTSAGSLQCFGDAEWGQIGDGSSGAGVIARAPVTVPGLSGVTEVATGRFHTCALAGGVVSCWGQNDGGRLGDGTTIPHFTPAPVIGL